MQLIIPMSGVGKRFINAGYKTPKPLIEIENESIISHILKMFQGIENVVFICNREHLEDEAINMRKRIKAFCSKAKIVSVEPHKYGPIYVYVATPIA